MLKKIILSSVVALGFNVGDVNAFGFGQDCCCQDYDFYVGVTGGVSALSGNYSTTTPVTGSTEKHYARIGGTHGLVGGVAGVQTTFCDNIYGALQFNALYNGFDQHTRSDTDTAGVQNNIVNIKNHFQWGFDARLGLTTCCGTTPYLLGGFEGGEFTQTLTNRSNTTFRGIPPNSSISHKKNLYGGKFGLGVNVPVMCSWSLNLEYSYTWFGTLRKHLTEGTTTVVNWDHKVQVRQNSFLLGLNYGF